MWSFKLDSRPPPIYGNVYTVAPLAWVPWVPGNPSIFEQWVPEPINIDTKSLNLPTFRKGTNRVFLDFGVTAEFGNP